MVIKDWMTKCVITVETNDYMLDAINLLKEHNIHRLPVMEKDRLVGIVSDKDLIRISLYDATPTEMNHLLCRVSKIRIGEIMTKNPITIPSDYTVDEAAHIFLKFKISGAPVTNNKKGMVGIITHTDLLRAQAQLSGLARRGISFAFNIEDRPGAIKNTVERIRKYEGRIASIHSSYEDVSQGFRKIYIRMYGIDRQRFQQLKEELQQKADLLYMVDHSENRRASYRKEKD